MAPKRTRSSKAFLSHLYKNLSFQEQENIFNWYLAEREVYTSCYLAEEIFKYCLFVEASNDTDLRNFIFEVPQERYPELVRMFYENLIYSYGVISSKVMEQPIAISLEDFSQACNLTFINQDYN